MVCVPFANLVVSSTHCMPSDILVSAPSEVESILKSTFVIPLPST